MFDLDFFAGIFICFTLALWLFASIRRFAAKGGMATRKAMPIRKREAYRVRIFFSLDFFLCGHGSKSITFHIVL